MNASEMFGEVVGYIEESQEKMIGVNREYSTMFRLGEGDAKHGIPAHVHIRDRQEYLDGFVSAGGKLDLLWVFNPNPKEVLGTTYFKG